MANNKLVKYSKVGAGIGITSWVISQIYGFFPKGSTGIQSSLQIAPIAEGVKQQIQSGVTSDLATNLIGLLNGAIQGGIMGFLTLVVAGIIVGIVGGYAIDFLKTFQMFKGLGAKVWSKITLIAVAGSIIAGLIVGLFSGNAELPLVSVVLTMGIYFLIIGLVYGVIANTKLAQRSKIFPDPR